jgi:hypothetical protein
MPNDEIDLSPRGYFRGTELASLGERWRAGAIDYLVVPGIVVVMFVVFVHSTWATLLAVIAVLLINNVLFETLVGQSIGKFFRGLTTFVSKVNDLQGNTFLCAPSLMRSVQRLGLFLVCDICTLYGLFRPAREGWRRCFSNSFTDTFVAVGRPRGLKLQDSFTYGRVEEFPNRREM